MWKNMQIIRDVKVFFYRFFLLISNSEDVLFQVSKKLVNLVSNLSTDLSCRNVVIKKIKTSMKEIF